MIKKLLLLCGMFMLVTVAVQLATPATVGASDETPRFGDAGDTSCSAKFLTLPPWYEGLPRTGCTLDTKSIEGTGNGLSAFIFRIVLNVIEMALQIVAYAAVGFIIYGGFKYLTSSGSADRITAGRKIIQNAVIGLVISLFSVVIVTLIADRIAV